MKHSYVRATLNQETNTIRMILARAMAVAATTKRVAMTLLLAVLTTATAWADEYDGWTYSPTTGGCVITACSDNTVTSINIPKTLGGYTVVAISRDVFSGFNDLKTINFHSDASIVNMPSVSNCAKFEAVYTIDANETDPKKKYKKDLLPASMTEIGNAFMGSGIKSLTMPGVTSIGDRAFEGCNSLESVTFGQAVSIGKYSNAFSKINNKKQVNEMWVYKRTVINYPGPMANWSCYNYMYSPNLVVNCTDGSCGWCGDEWSDGMEPFQNSSCVYWTLLDDNGHLTIDCIPQDIIYDNYLSKQIIMTESWDREKVKSLTLEHVNITYGVLNEYPNLTTIMISKDVTSGLSFPFSYCPSVTTIVIDRNNPIYDSRDGCNAIIETATNTLIVGCKNTFIPSSVTTIGPGSFCGSGLTSFTIPNNVTSIESYAFYNCTSLNSVTIPNSVTTIGNYAFHGCTSLSSITIPNSVTTINHGIFYNCTGLTSITIPNNVTTIQKAAFYNCTGLTSITIPNRVTTIDDWVFYNCSNLIDIYYDGTPEQWNQVTKGWKWNDGVSSIFQVFYPSAVTTTAATIVEIPYGQEWTDIPVTVSSLNLGWFQNEGKPAHRADAVAVTPFVGSGASSAFTFYDGQRTIDASKGAGEHTVGNRVSEQLTAVGQSGTLWVHIPKTTWDAATAGSYSQNLYYDAAFLYNGVTPAETGIYNLGSDAMVNVRLTVPEAVTLTFDSNNGSNAVDALSGRAGIAMTIPNCTFTPWMDHLFVCWNTKADGTGKRYFVGRNYTFSENTTLYAEWGHEAVIDLTEVTEKVVDLDVWDLLTMLDGYMHYGDDGRPLIDVNLDGAADLQLLRPEFDDWTGQYVGDYAVKKLAGAANLSGSYRFLLPCNIALIKFTTDDATVEQPCLELLDNDNGNINSTKRLLDLKDGQLHHLMLSERTLYRDGYWNTLCLPFAVGSFTGTPLEGATVMELDTETTYDGHKTGLEADGTLYLNFKDATSIEAGKPYIVKWTNTATNIVNPVFCSVTVTAQAKAIPNPYRYSYDDPEYITVAVPGSVSFTGGKFCGTYDPTDIYDDEHDKFYLGNNNKLYWPETDGYSVKAFRAYFDLSPAAAGVREFHLSFGEEGETTGIVSIENGKLKIENEAGAGWYDLSGRKLQGKPTKKGLYINNGRKVVIK